MGKSTPAKFKTYGNVFDDFTQRNLFKLASQGHFDQMESPIKIGKEANIFSARTKDGERRIVKIYRLQNCDFNKMFDYIKQDPRYTGVKKRRREIIFSWTQREFRNILIAREANLRVPTPYVCMHNIIVMEFIGDEMPAPQLKNELAEDREQYKKEVFKMMKTLHKAGLVHGDLSEFNILTHKDKPVFIDFSQATPTNAPNAKALLERDCKNLAKFFTKIGLKTDAEELFLEITKKKS